MKLFLLTTLFSCLVDACTSDNTTAIQVTGGNVLNNANCTDAITGEEIETTIQLNLTKPFSELTENETNSIQNDCVEMYNNIALTDCGPDTVFATECSFLPGPNDNTTTTPARRTQSEFDEQSSFPYLFLTGNTADPETPFFSNFRRHLKEQQGLRGSKRDGLDQDFKHRHLQTVSFEEYTQALIDNNAAIQDAQEVSPSDQSSTSPYSAPSFESFSHRVCGNFAVYAQTTVTFAGVSSVIDGGDVGVSTAGTPITGAVSIIAGGEIGADSVFATSVLVAHSEAMAGTFIQIDEEPLAIEIGGEIFTPGIYRSVSLINFAYGTHVTLDGKNESNPVFLFIAGTTLVTAADTYFILKNGAKAENVLWVLGTAATLGANSVLEGSILAGSAITFGTGSELHGCALAQSTVFFESGGSVVMLDGL